jgi:hypothetical protein
MMRHAGDGRTSCRGCKGAMRLAASRALLVSIVSCGCVIKRDSVSTRWRRHHYIRRTDEAPRCFYIVLRRDREIHSNAVNALFDSISRRQRETNMRTHTDTVLVNARYVRL